MITILILYTIPSRTILHSSHLHRWRYLNNTHTCRIHTEEMKSRSQSQYRPKIGVALQKQKFDETASPTEPGTTMSNNDNNTTSRKKIPESLPKLRKSRLASWNSLKEMLPHLCAAKLKGDCDPELKPYRLSFRPVQKWLWNEREHIRSDRAEMRPKQKHGVCRGLFVCLFVCCPIRWPFPSGSSSWSETRRPINA
jgi:hypothetical protein